MPYANTDSLAAADINNCLRGLKRDNTTYTVTGTTNETDLASFTMTGGTMTATGGIHILAAGTITGTAGTKRIRLYFGGTAIVDTTAATGSSDWFLEAWVYNTAANAQRILGIWSDHQSATNFNKDYTTLAIDTSANAVIKVTGTLGNSGDTITQALYDIYIAQIT